MNTPIFTQRCGKNVATFDQGEVSQGFIQVAKSLNFRVATTGGSTLTHEISDCTKRDWDTLVELASENNLKA